ncbi:hypothetical protein FCL40_17775 [Ferrimonas sediminicola]|uniref:Uncharacterized protein n=1 Tax=Ferrimonas sediminicola TaxID=2569538 RepID=A0A4U1B7N4_9GAMM|nr:hypothetical protein [Ferrimonas sediminicola]TKB46499.1 hypothetical protein FCL40_17775 [Ferrimonas sediminicola]
MSSNDIRKLQDVLGIELVINNQLDGRRISPNEKGEINMRNYNKYVAWLKSNDLQFPSNRQGEVNRKRISDICNFGRDILYKDTNAVAQQFDTDVKNIGVGASVSKDANETLAAKEKASSATASRLQTELEAKTKEVEELRKQIKDLKSRLRLAEIKGEEQQASFDMMLETGGRIFL